MSDTVVLARFITRHEGELAQGFLQQRGIPAALFADDAGGAEAGMTFVNPARLTVLAEYAAEAGQVLHDAGYEVEVQVDGAHDDASASSEPPMNEADPQ